jgi:hypothetical protein
VTVVAAETALIGAQAETALPRVAAETALIGAQAETALTARRAGRR